MQFLKRNITPGESRDTGMAMVLLLLLLFAYLRRDALWIAAIACQILSMTVPGVFRPVASVWLGLSQVLGAITSKILLGVVFFCVVTPIGLLRRMLGKDSLKLRAFKAGRESVLTPRDHVFTGADILKPY
jgi:hypothetical protein